MFEKARLWRSWPDICAGIIDQALGLHLSCFSTSFAMFTQAKNPTAASALCWAMALIVWSTFTCGSSAQAQTFTVLTNAGVNVRKGPGAEYAKLATLPFGTVVKAKYTEQMLLCQQTDTMAPGCIKIEGRRGYWIEVTHKEITGYVFSGFGLMGLYSEIPDPARDLGIFGFKSPDSPMEDYVLLDFFGHERFDPRLYWVGLVKVGDRLEWQKIQPRLKLKNEFTKEDFANDGCGGFLDYPQIEGPGRIMLGMRVPWTDAQLKTISSMALPLPLEEHRSGGIGKALALDERYAFEWAGVACELHAFNAKMIDPKKTGTDIGLELRIGKGAAARYFNVAKMMDTDWGWERRIGESELPMVTWVGDLNQDGGVDLLLYALDNTNENIYNRTFTLILSQRTPEGYEMHMAAQSSPRH